MSENPVRSASEEAAKQITFLCRNNLAMRRPCEENMATVIEENLAPVVAAAEEAMKKKCAVVCEDELRKIAAASVGGTPMSKLTAGEVYGFTESARQIRAIPTGTALAEYVERATAELAVVRHEINSHCVVCNSVHQPIGGPGCICAVLPRKHLAQLRDEIASLKAQLADLQKDKNDSCNI